MTASQREEAKGSNTKCGSDYSDNFIVTAVFLTQCMVYFSSQVENRLHLKEITKGIEELYTFQHNPFKRSVYDKLQQQSAIELNGVK